MRSMLPDTLGAEGPASPRSATVNRFLEVSQFLVSAATSGPASDPSVCRLTSSLQTFAAWLYEMYLSLAMRLRMQLTTWLANWRLTAHDACAGSAARAAVLVSAAPAI